MWSKSSAASEWRQNYFWMYGCDYKESNNCHKRHNHLNGTTARNEGMSWTLQLQVSWYDKPLQRSLKERRKGK
jgi:hypothetical protein